MRRTECTSALLRERYFKIEHESGLEVYVFPKQLTTTYALLAARYGSMDDCFTADGECIRVPDGTAHFLEHKMFENEDGSDSFARFTALGADANAYTSYNRTAYLFSCTGQMEQPLEELLRFVTHPYFTAETVAKEQGIIAEEIRMYEDNPWERGFQNLLCALYRCHPVRKNICGSEASIAQITPELLYRCHAMFYRPSNLVLVVCGDVTEQQVTELAKRALRGCHRLEKPCRTRPSEPESVCTPQIRTRMQVAKPIFHIGFKDVESGRKSPAERLRRDAAMTLLGETLFSRAGAFYNRLFESELITPSFSFGYSSLEDVAFFELAGESEHPEQVVRALTEELERVCREGICLEELERCRRVLYADEIRAYDSTEEIANRLLNFVLDGGELFSYPQLLQDVTVAQLRELLQTVFQKEHMAVSVVEPLE